MGDIYIGLARYDENHKQSGGHPGDQLQTGLVDTTGEVAFVSLSEFLNNKSCTIYRLIDIDRSVKTGEGIYKAVNNPYIGYDETNRLDILTYGVYAGKNGKMAECDNTSLARVVIKYGTGIDLGNFNNNTVREYLDDSDMFDTAVKYSDTTPIYLGDVLIIDDDNLVGICGIGPARVKPKPEGAKSYNELEDLPSINGTVVQGDKSSEDYHISGGGYGRPTVSGEQLIFK
jgi:hypothetical protein